MLKKTSFFMAILFLLTILVSCQQEQNEPVAKRPILVDVTTVGRGQISKEIKFTGSIEASTEVRVFAKISAIIEELRVDSGDRINKGDLIAVLEAAELRAQVAQAKAALKVMEAKWDQMNVGARSEEIAQAEDLVSKAKANLNNTEHNYRRMKALFKGGTVSERQFETADLEYTVARADFNSAQERLDMLRKGATREDRQALQAQVNQAKAALDLARIRLTYTRITSPINGIISQSFFDPGDLAVPTKTLVTIVQMDTVKAIVYFPENQIRFMAPGLQAEITVAAYPDHVFSGTIDKVSPTLNPATRMFSAEIRVLNEKHLLRPGMFARVTISVDPHHNTLLVPKEAILYGEQYLENSDNSEAKISQVNYVFVVEEGKAHMRKVSLGHESGPMVEVCSGVKKGDKVVIRGLHQITDGDRVTVIKDKVSQT